MSSQVMVVFTDGLSVFLVRRHRLWTIPDTAFLWPLEKKKGSFKDTGIHLLKIASVGTIDITKLEQWKPVVSQLHQVFGLSENYRCVVIQTCPEVFQYVCQTTKNVYKYMHKYTETIFEPNTMSITEILDSKNCSLESIHCIRAFLDTNKCI
jgi:hypothetical protein